MTGCFAVVGQGSLFLQACLRSLLTECDIVLIVEYPPKQRIPVA